MTNNNNNNKSNDDNNNDDSCNRSSKAAAWRRHGAPSSSQVQTVLTQARRDLWSSREPPAMFLLIPLRDYCLDPYLALSGILWPRLVTAGSRWDAAVAGSFEIGCVPVIRLLYGRSQAAAAFNHKAASSRTVARQAVLFDNAHPHEGNALLSRPQREKPSNFRSAFSGALAFLVSAVADILQAIRNPAKMSKWYACLTQLDGYLAASGVGDQLAEAVTKPLWAGRLWDNLKILNDIQEQDDVDRIVHAALYKNNKNRSGVDGSTSTEQEQQQQQEQAHHLQMGHRLMRFATAAYGTEMIQSAADAAVDYSQMYESTKAAICSHAQLDSPDDVQLLYTGNNNSINNDDAADDENNNDTNNNNNNNSTDPNTTPEPDKTNDAETSGSKSGHVLHHFVAVDHQLKAVVLALRGTLSISGALVDLQAMECDFCDGAVQAHSGIAKMAENVWQQSGAAIQQILQQWPDYKFILTGHSLGAGTACLLNLKCHVQPHLIPPGSGSGTNNHQRPIECYAFAPPPVACWHQRPSGTTETTKKQEENQQDLQQQQQQQVRVQQAVQNCVAYIHDNDVVPHLSVAAVCRLAALLDAVDNCTEHIWFWKRWLIYQEWRPIPENIWTAVRQVVAKQQEEQEQEQQEKETAENTTATTTPLPSVVMTIPAKVVVWCQQNVLNDRFTAISCDPAAVARGNIFVCPDMVTDHLCEQYEDALDDLVVVSSSSSSSSS